MEASRQQIKDVGRLKKRSDFLRARREGGKWVAKGMIVIAAPGETDKIRFGITVTRRLSKSAVVRNRIKRRLRAAAFDVIPSYSDAAADIVLIGRPETAARPYTDLKKDLRWCLGKLGYKKRDEH